MISRLGLRGHDFGKCNSKEIAKNVTDSGFNTVQLALAKSFNVNLDEGVDESLLKQIKSDFDEKDLEIAVLGCYLNNYICDTEERRLKNIEIWKNHLHYNKILNARVVGTEAGNILPDHKLQPDDHNDIGYNLFAKFCYEIFDEAENLGVDIGIEPVFSHILYDNKTTKKLIDDMNSKHFKIIYDPVNLLNMDNYKNANDIIDESFELYGDLIEVVHYKDFTIEDRLNTCDHGEGLFNPDFLFKKIKESNNKIDIMCESANINKLDKILNILNKI